MENLVNSTSDEARQSSTVIVTTEYALRHIIFDCLNQSKQVPIPEPELKPDKLLHSIKEGADFLGCSTVTFQKIKNSGRIRYRQIGRKCIFSTKELLEDLAKINKKGR